MGGKKIGIITIVKVNNYGAELQAYATQRKLSLIGYDAEIIDYLYYRNPGHVRERESRPFYPYPLKNRVKEFGLKAMDMLGRLRMTEVGRRRGENFAKFHRQFCRFSPKQYRRHSELFGDPPVYDVYCVGSDQVWNPRCFTNLDAYFLDFAPAGKRRFSYGSSFGVKEIPESARAAYSRYLSRIDRLSVRESTGVGLVKLLTGKEAKLVADPTLLLSRDEWMAVAEPVDGLPESYVLVYELHPTPYLMDVARDVARQRGWKIVRICKDARPGASGGGDIVDISDAGPSQFVYLFDKASAVVTNSFHGTAFGVNFRKDLFCVLSAAATNNGRQESLLRRLGMEDRLLYDSERCDIASLAPIDYESAGRRLDALREESVAFIKESVE